MARKKISELESATDVTASDLIQIVDVEDSGMAITGTNKKATASLLAKELAKQPLEPGVVISGSSSSDAVRITQTGTGNALVVEDSTNPDSNPFIIANNGNVAIGLTIAPNDALKVRRTGSENAVFSVDSETGVNYIVQNKFSSDGNGSSFQFRKYRGSIGSVASAQNNDVIGSFDALGYDGSNIVYSAQISAHVDGTPGTNDMPGRLVFSTTADGASAPTERMRITSAGNVGIGTSSPSAKLDIAGSNEFSLGLQATTTSTQTPILNHPVMMLANSSTAAGNGLSVRFQIADTGGTSRLAGGVGTVATAKTGSTVTADMYFYVGTSERMRITSAGNVGIGTSSPDASCLLDLSSTSRGFRPPSMTTAQRNLIASPVAGVMVYNTTTNKLNFYNGSAWEAVTSAV